MSGKRLCGPRAAAAAAALALALAARSGGAANRGGIKGYLSAMFCFPGSGTTVALTANDCRGGDPMGLFARLAEIAA